MPPLILQQVLWGLRGRSCHLGFLGRGGAQRSPLASHSEQTSQQGASTSQAVQLRATGEARPGAHSLCRGLRVAWESMKGTEGRVARGPLHKQLDLERKHARQAEARLSQHLQGLERAYLCHLKLLAWEQRQLQKQLQRLHQGNREGAAGPGSGSSWNAHPSSLSPARTLVLLLSGFAFHSAPLHTPLRGFHLFSMPGLYHSAQR